MSLLVDLVQSGIVLGALYALFAYGLTIIISVTHVWHFAYAVSLSLASYTVWFTVSELQQPVVLGIALAVIVASLTSVGMELLVYGPLRRRGASDVLILVASLAIVSLVQGVLIVMFGTVPKVAFPGGALGGRWEWMGLTGNYWELAVLATALAIVVATAFLLQRTRTGAMLRAVGSNPYRAESVGISRRRAFSMAFVIGGAITVAPATLMLARQPLTVYGGLDFLVLAIVAIVIGGVGSPIGALVGGMIVGVTQALTALWLGTVWSELVLFGLLFMSLLLRRVRSHSRDAVPAGELT